MLYAFSLTVKRKANECYKRLSFLTSLAMKRLSNPVSGMHFLFEASMKNMCTADCALRVMWPVRCEKRKESYPNKMLFRLSVIGII